MGHDDEAQLTAVEQPHHDIRRELEAAVEPLARSLDGRSFELQTPVDEPVQPGSYVSIATGDGAVLGQVVESRLDLREGPEVETHRRARHASHRVAYHVVGGRGVVLEEAAPFHEAPLRAAQPGEVSAYLDRTAPEAGTAGDRPAAFAPEVPARLDAGGFGRHTFLCGQSGSGKSYALSVMLEQLLLETDLRIVVLDPNSDFARLPETRDGADPGPAARWAERASTWRCAAPGGTGAGGCTCGSSTSAPVAGRRWPSSTRCATGTSTPPC